jgi:hypothetical protein
MAVPEPGSAGARELGGAPRDGDFARLLEAASAPAAHRMRIDPATLGLEDAASRAARAGRFTGTPPVEAATSQPPEDMGRPERAASSAASRPAAAPYGPPGMAEGRTRALPPRGASPGGTTEPALALAAAVTGWGRRPLKDRVIAVLFGLAGLWILVSILSAAARDFGDATGLLFVIAVIAFMVLRGRARRQRPPDAP